MAPAVEVISVHKSLGSQEVVRDISFQIRPGEFFSLLGPSGCGKSTTLRLIAGFERPNKGEIRINGSASNGTPAFVHDVNLVFQNYALFPHLNVAANVAFGLEMQKKSKAEIAREVAQILELVRLSGYGHRYPRELSGGQQQRVALARALVTRPSVILLDEPLGALDLKLRKEMQGELKNLQRRLGQTFVYVTHDQEEALAMSDRIAVMHEGRILQIGSPEEIYQSPSTRFVAHFIGESNFLEAVWLEQLPENQVLVAAGDFRFVATNRSGQSETTHQAGERVLVVLRPEHIRLQHMVRPDDMRIEGVVEQCTFLGSTRSIGVRLPDDQKIIVRLASDGGEPIPAQGDQIQLGWNGRDASLVRGD